MTLECNFSGTLDQYYAEQEAYEADEERKQNEADASAEMTLINGPALNKAWLEYDLWDKISPYQLAEIFRDMPTEPTPTQIVRILARLAAIRTALHSHLAEQIREA